MRDRVIWIGLATTAVAVASLIMLVVVGGDDSGSRVSTSGPIVSVEDARLTDAQRRRAADLLQETRRTLREFPDDASLLAAGYRPFFEGEAAGRAAGAIEHFMNADYLADGRELDAGRIESVMTEEQPDGSKVVVGGMYILEPGATMAHVPDVAGELTPWHEHGDVCLDQSGARVVGLLVNGECVPSGTLKSMPPMIHVWLTDTPCGPFAGLVGHGRACLEPDGVTSSQPSTPATASTAAR